MTKDEFRVRNQTIYARYQQVRNYRAVGQEFGGLSGNRIAQICRNLIREKWRARQRGRLKLAADTPLHLMGFSHRTWRCLHYYFRVDIAGDIAGVSDSVLLRVPNFGRKSLHEVHTVLEELGLR